MVLSHGACRAAGFREMLRIFRLSSHNALAVGDAENDHDLLHECEVGAAVAWEASGSGRSPTTWSQAMARRIRPSI